MQEQKHTLWFHLFDVLLNIVIIVAIVAAIRTFLVSPFQVEGSSMIPTLEHKQYIIINKLAYLAGDPERGDVVVFRPPNDPRKHYVKRVIGLPGDEVILRSGFVYLREPDSEEEHKLTEESYLNAKNLGETFQHPPSGGNTKEIRYKIEEGKYFLLGDNRKGSLDSRSFTDAKGNSAAGVPRKNIKGRVWFVALPVTNIHALELPVYGM